jgi:UDP-N-acetylmuramate dehydrogenase
MEQLISDLYAARIGRILPHEVLAPYTTWKIGGPADLLVEPYDAPALQKTLQLIRQHQCQWSVLGRGSNILIADKGIRGVVILLGEGFETIQFDQQFVTAGAAFSLIKLSVLAAKQGLTGLEFAGGIPGSVGGAVFMNAGAHGSDISKILKHVVLIDDDGKQVVMNAEQMDYRYRHSILQFRRYIAIQALFELAYGDRKEIAGAMASYKDRRLKTQPLQLACAGSVFRNPTPYFAAKLIEDAGLKGTRRGDAVVSTLHANFIVNEGHATALDVIHLIDHVQQTIQVMYGIELVPEIMVIGER